MKLSVMERMMLLNLLPPTGTFANLKVLRIAREALSFDDKEHKLLNIRYEGEGDRTQMRWDNHVIVDKATGRSPDGTPETVQEMIRKNPDDFEMKPIMDDKNVIVGEIVTQMIVKKLKELNGKEELTEQHYSLYEKFVEPPVQAVPDAPKTEVATPKEY